MDTVGQALDRDGTEMEPVATDAFGTRHRSVFRFCNAHSDVIAIVVSQDGQARFVKNLGGRVVYFDHRVLGAL